jgi:alkylation response protein AidB-like acyl-CoA dehydrogenase
VPVDALIGEENKGFRYILDGLNAERILVAAEAIGDAHFFVRKATRYANARVVFERPIGANQGVQFPIERAADLMNRAAAALFDAGQPCGEGRRTWPSCWHRRPRGMPLIPRCRRMAGSATRASTTSSAHGASVASSRSHRSPPI